MLTLLFFVCAVVLIASAVKRPRKLWQRGVTYLAGILLIAVLVAWAIEFVMRATPG